MDVHEATVERDIMRYIGDCKITDENRAEMKLKEGIDEESLNSFLTSDMAFLFRKVPTLVGISIEIPVDSVTCRFLRIDREAELKFWGIDFAMDDKRWNEYWSSPESNVKARAFIREYLKDQ